MYTQSSPRYEPVVDADQKLEAESELRSPDDGCSSSVGKPLPSPNVWGQVAIGAARVQHGLGRSRLGRFDTGWRATVTAGMGIAVLVLVFNIALLSWAWTQPWDAFTGTRTIAYGDCSQTQNIFTYTHLAINVASSLLLSTSNAAMQCLSAPTRKEVDRAHAVGKWLDVGISGFRNWPHIAAWRQWCWAFLIVSTVPLHLLYNSVLFSTTTANEYFALVVPSNFSTGPVLSPSANSPADKILYNLTQLAQEGKLVRKDREDCISAYNQELVDTYSNLLIVTTNASEIMPLWSFDFRPTPMVGSDSKVLDVSAWLCGDQVCDKDWVAAHPQDWNITAPSNATGSKQLYSVDHCLVQEVDAACTIQFIPGIMIIVVICNAVKVACFLAALLTRTFTPLITLGDAMSSFLDRPEPCTADLGPLSAADVRDAEKRAHVTKVVRVNSGVVANQTDELDPIARLPFRYGPWRTRQLRWFSGASRSRWHATYGLLIVVSAVGWTFFGISAEGADSFQNQWANGLGTVHLNSLLEAFSYGTVAGIVLLSNVFQLLLSLTYVSFNGLFTSILLSREFGTYAEKRAALRVSQPRGQYQRSTYYLSLPYRFAVPLTILSILLHWAFSQSLFLAEIHVYDPQGNFDPLYSVSCLGYSTLSLLITMVLAVILMISPVALGWIRYRPGAPLVESNTFAISAACHPLHPQAEESRMLIKYGALSETRGKRISLSSERVEPLIPGERYTNRDEISAEALARTSETAIQLTRRQVLWKRVLAVLMFIKFVIFMVYTVEGSLTQTSGDSNAFLSGLDAPDTVMSVFAVMTLFFVLGRAAISLLRTWRRKKLRHFWWHVATEAAFFVMWFVIFVWIVWFMSGDVKNPELVSSLTSGPTNFYVDISTGFMLAFLLSTAIETWLWWQQFRPETPTRLSHTTLEASRWVGVPLRR